MPSVVALTMPTRITKSPITFRLKDIELEQKFLIEANEEGFVGLNGHRSVGGCRASTYNAVPYETSQALSEFMIEFQERNG